MAKPCAVLRVTCNGVNVPIMAGRCGGWQRIEFDTTIIGMEHVGVLLAEGYFVPCDAVELGIGYRVETETAGSFDIVVGDWIPSLLRRTYNFTSVGPPIQDGSVTLDVDGHSNEPRLPRGGYF